MKIKDELRSFWSFLRMEFWRSLNLGASLALCLVILTASSLPPAEPEDRARSFTRRFEFDYVGWTVDALLVKLGQSALDAPSLLDQEEQKQVVLKYIELIREIDRTEFEIEKIYADPKITDKPTALAPWQAKLGELRDRNLRLAPIAEQVMQGQVGAILNDLGLNLGGQTLPPTLYHTSPLPYALIISPRDVIRQDNNISLLPDLTLEQMVDLEKQVETNLDYSALVVPIGGIGTYPTMVMSTSNLNWLAEVVAHEWTHNYLTLRPLGWNYETTPQLRTMNETTASLAGKEIGEALIRRFYPELAPAPAPTRTPKPEQQKTPTPSTPEPARFDFNKEMRFTRVTADQLLVEGKVEEAETFMEARRQVFWDNGYLIRKLNQAYFAFHGAYADVPGGGSAGSDPVGPAVVALRERSASLAEFLNRISWMTSFETLEQTVSN